VIVIVRHLTVTAGARRTIQPSLSAGARPTWCFFIGMQITDISRYPFDIDATPKELFIGSVLLWAGHAADAIVAAVVGSTKPNSHRTRNLIDSFYTWGRSCFVRLLSKLIVCLAHVFFDLQSVQSVTE